MWHSFVGEEPYKALPFEPLIPNKTTIAAMCEARAGNLPQVGRVDALVMAFHAASLDATPQPGDKLP